MMHLAARLLAHAPTAEPATVAGVVHGLRARAGRRRRRLATSQLRAASFTYKSLEAERERRMMRALGCQDPAFEVNAKDDAHAWAQRLGVRTPRLLAVHEDVHDLDWGAVPDRFVLKPTGGTTSTGVYLLTRDGAGWRDLVSRRVLTSGVIDREIAALVDRKQVSASFLVEELVEDPRYPGEQPIDYKVMTFFGRVGIIEAKSHGIDPSGRPVASWRVFDAAWTDLGDIFNTRRDATIPPALHADELLDLARRVSAAIPRPFLRVDLFDSADGPLLGEITPEPGGDNTPPARLDRLLGSYWEDAEARLKVRAARSGALTPADRPLAEALINADL